MLINLRNALMAGGSEPAPAYWGLCFTAEEANSTISMTKGSSAPTLSLVTSVNYGKTWETFTPGVTTITLANMGDSVWFAAGEGGNIQTAFSANVNRRNTFAMTGRISATGSIMSVLNASEPTYECPAANTFTYLFHDCTSLVSAPELPAQTLMGDCYSSMFSGCTALTTAPELPAQTMKIGCYYQMFQGCTSLVSAPELPAQTLAQNCYRQMFQGCTSLASAPELPAQTLATSCYREMFSGCISLKQTPDLPVTTANQANACNQMFYNCTGLERTGRIAIATATGTSALAQMFYGCSNLQYIELSGMTTWPTSSRMTDWVSGVSATGTFKCPAALGTNETIARGTSRCPNGWTVVNI